MQPLALSRDNVLMAHKEDGLFAAFAFPVIQEVAVNDGALELFMHQREQLFKYLMKAEELLFLVDIRVRGRVVLDHLRELLRK